MFQLLSISASTVTCNFVFYKEILRSIADLGVYNGYRKAQMDRTISIPIIISLLAIGIFGWVGYIISAVWLFIPATLIAFLIYLRKAYKKMPPPERILPLYLLALSIQMLHFTEEYLTSLVTELPALFGQEPYPEDYWLVFNMSAYAFFLLGGIVLYKRIKELAIIPLFFILVGVAFNAAAHIGLALYTNSYFPGLYTAMFYLLLAPPLLKTIL
ncbi:MAG: HXXEE domain-containing protein [Flavobacteriaceae bacterium]